MFGGNIFPPSTKPCIIEKPGGMVDADGAVVYNYYERHFYH